MYNQDMTKYIVKFAIFFCVLMLIPAAFSFAQFAEENVQVDIVLDGDLVDASSENPSINIEFENFPEEFTSELESIKEEISEEGFAGEVFGLVAGFGLLAGVVLIFSLAAFIFWLLMLIHAASKKIKNKTMWIVLLAVSVPLSMFFPLAFLIVAVVYYFVIKRKFSKNNNQDSDKK